MPRKAKAEVESETSEDEIVDEEVKKKPTKKTPAKKPVKKTAKPVSKGSKAAASKNTKKAVSKDKDKDESENETKSESDDLPDIADDSEDLGQINEDENDHGEVVTKQVRKEISPLTPIGDLSATDILLFLIQKGTSEANPVLRHGSSELRGQLMGRRSRHAPKKQFSNGRQFESNTNNYDRNQNHNQNSNRGSYRGGANSNRPSYHQSDRYNNDSHPRRNDQETFEPQEYTGSNTNRGGRNPNYRDRGAINNNNNNNRRPYKQEDKPDIYTI